MLLCEQVSALPRIVIAPFSVKRVLHPVLTLSEICLRFFAMYYQIIVPEFYQHFNLSRVNNKQ